MKFLRGSPSLGNRLDAIARGEAPFTKSEFRLHRRRMARVLVGYDHMPRDPTYEEALASCWEEYGDEAAAQAPPPART